MDKPDIQLAVDLQGDDNTHARPAFDTDALFADDVEISDNIVHSPPQDPAPVAEVDVNALFAEFENDDLSYKPLAPALDLESLRREAKARHAKNIVPFTSVEVIQNNSLRTSGTGSGNALDIGTEEGAKKERKKLPKLDEKRLLDPDGFPQLIKDTKHFKPKGKGYEVRTPTIGNLPELSNLFALGTRPQSTSQHIPILDTPYVPQNTIPRHY
jgi:hypothetical protein